MLVKIEVIGGALVAINPEEVSTVTVELFVRGAGGFEGSVIRMKNGLEFAVEDAVETLADTLNEGCPS